MRRFIELLLVPKRFPIWARYILTTFAVVAVLSLRSLLTDDPRELRFLLMFPTIILSGVIFDRGNAVWATFLTTATIAYFMMPPVGSFSVEREIDAISLGLYVALGFATSTIIEALHLAYEEAKERQQRLQEIADERNLRLGEMSHRMQNDLGTILAMLRLSARDSEPQAQSALLTASDRVEVLTRVHRRLRPSDGDVALDTASFFIDLCEDLQVSLQRLSPVVIRTDVESHPMDTRLSTAFGLMLNELLTNATKYAGADAQTIVVDVAFKKVDGRFCLSVRDYGPGVEPGVIKGGGLGHRLIRTLAAQIGAVVAMGNTEPGFQVTVTVPVQ